MRKNELFIDYTDTDYILSCIINVKNFPEIYDKYIVDFKMNEMLENICAIQQMNVFLLTCIAIVFIFRFFLG